MNVGPLNPGEPDMNIETRPRPIKTAADELRTWIGLASALITAAGTGGILLSADKVDALQGVLAAGVPLATAIAVALTAFGVRKRSEPLVTPMQDPRDNDGTQLVAIPPRGSVSGTLG